MRFIPTRTGMLRKFWSAHIPIPKIKLFLAVKILHKAGRRMAFDSFVNEFSKYLPFYKIN